MPAPASAEGKGGPATLKMPEASDKKTGKEKEKAAPTPTRGKPSNGAELQKRLYEKDAQLAHAGLSKPGELVKFIVQAGTKAGHEADLATWNEQAIDLAINETRAFETQRKAQTAALPQKEVA